MALAQVINDIVGDDVPLRIEVFDGSTVDRNEPVATLVITSPDALARIITHPGELGLSRAYVAGDLDIAGDLYLGARSRPLAVEPADRPGHHGSAAQRRWSPSPSPTAPSGRGGAASAV